VPRTPGAVVLRRRREPAPPHLVELGARGHVLREQRGLDALEEPFEPADELRLRDADLGLARRALERERERVELVLELVRERLAERRWSRLRPASSSGACRTSPSSSLIIEPMRMSFAGCWTNSWPWDSASSWA
jgi:nucleotidyltransferase/DNA polymerase involved in DNA repair